MQIDIHSQMNIKKVLQIEIIPFKKYSKALENEAR